MLGRGEASSIKGMYRLFNHGCFALTNVVALFTCHVELVTDQGYTLHVFVIHTKNNEIEIPKLIGISDPYFAEKTIVMGDFNAGYDYLLDLGFRDTVLKWIATDTQWSIDQIWVSPSLTSYTKQKFGGVSYTSEGILSVSDHLPVFAEIGLYPP